MSEVLTKEEMVAFKETPTMLEMGELRKTITLQDIPLSEGKTSQHEHEGDGNERKLKTNSLKRFFHLPNKKKSGDEDFFEAEKLENKSKKENISNELHSPKELTGSNSIATLKSSLNSYWNSVFKQKKSKKSSKSQIELEHNLVGEAASSSINTEQRLSLVANKLKESVLNAADDANTLQEIQSLQISETCAPK